MSAKGAAIVLACVVTVLAGVFALRFALEWADGADPSNLLTALDGGDISSLSVATPASTVLWKVHRPTGANIEKIEYGAILAGFVQDAPMSGLPRALVDDEPLKIRMESERWWCEHYGRASGSSGFQGGLWECGRTGAEASTRGRDRWASPR